MTQAIEDEGAATRSRAKPMAPDERRAMIAASAVPLFLEHGRDLTTRQLAEHLGIAEGTLFRAFGDKESLVRAAVQAFFDHARERMAEGVVDPDLPLEAKVRTIVGGMRRWMQDLFRMLALVDRAEIPQFVRPDRERTYQEALARAFAPNAEELRIPPEQMAAVMRIAGIAANAARVDEGAGLDEEDIVEFILYGIAGAPRGKE